MSDCGSKRSVEEISDPVSQPEAKRSREAHPNRILHPEWKQFLRVHNLCPCPSATCVHEDECACSPPRAPSVPCVHEEACTCPPSIDPSVTCVHDEVCTCSPSRIPGCYCDDVDLRLAGDLVSHLPDSINCRGGSHQVLYSMPIRPPRPGAPPKYLAGLVGDQRRNSELEFMGHCVENDKERNKMTLGYVLMDPATTLAVLQEMEDLVQRDEDIFEGLIWHDSIFDVIDVSCVRLNGRDVYVIKLGDTAHGVTMDITANKGPLGFLLETLSLVRKSPLLSEHICAIDWSQFKGSELYTKKCSIPSQFRCDGYGCKCRFLGRNVPVPTRDNPRCDDCVDEYGQFLEFVPYSTGRMEACKLLLEARRTAETIVATHTVSSSSS